jgi:hydrogenase expression/formation protein HypD
MIRVPGTKKTLEEVKSEGGDVRVVYSVYDAVKIAQKTEKEVVFFGIGFETTAPMTAAVLVNGSKNPESLPPNFSVLTSYKLIPPAMKALSEMPEVKVKGYLAPGHVSTIIGTRPYELFPRKYHLPTVIAGFEPLDILYAIGLLLKQLRERAKVENAYPRSVSPEGNKRAQDLLSQVFQITDVYWRGIGIIPDSGLELKEEFSKWDARKKFQIKVKAEEKLHPGCKCDLIITAQATPGECSLFKNGRCNPRDPYGPCMVGEEAMCNIWYRYGGRPRL